VRKCQRTEELSIEDMIIRITNKLCSIMNNGPPCGNKHKYSLAKKLFVN
jgi:hypothetical protein